MDFDAFERTKNRLVPEIATWLRELRNMSGGVDPRPLLKQLYDREDAVGLATRERLGGIESGAITPAEMNVMIDLAHTRL